MKRGFVGERLDLDEIPGSYGLPVLGHTLAVARDMYSYGLEMRERYGPVYRANALFMRYVGLAAPDAVQIVLKEQEKLFSAKLAMDGFFGRVFPASLPVMEPAEHRHHRRILQTVFKKPYMVSYLEIMNDIAVEQTQHWQTGQEVELFPLLKTLTLDIAARAFLGMPLEENAEQVGKTFLELNKGIIAIVPVPVPGLTLWKALRAQRSLLAFFRPMVAEKRKSGASDMFARLCSAVDENGETLSDDAVLYHLLQFLGAAHDTTTATLSVILNYLVEQPDWQRTVCDEINTLDSDELAYDVLDQLEKTEWVIKEALRLYPPIPLITRRLVDGCDMLGFHLHEGTQIVIDVAAIHRSPHYWQQPNVFDPERFSSQRSEHKQHPYQWIPFGGGAHTCIGLHFSIMVIKVVLFHIFKRFEIHKSRQEPETFLTFPVTKPRHDLPVVLRIARSGLSQSSG